MTPDARSSTGTAGRPASHAARDTDPLTGHVIGVIGVGDIARAIVEGLSTGPRPPEVRLSPRNAATASGLADRFENVTVCASNAAVARAASVLIIAVRPDDVEAALEGLTVGPDVVVVSVMAGVTTARLRRLVGPACTVVRAMPLPAVRTRRSVTAVLPHHPVSTALFDRLGGSLRVADSAAFDVLSAVTATMSSVFALTLVVAEWAGSHGMDAADAERYARNVHGNLGAPLLRSETALADLVAAHQTRGGLNEQLQQAWLRGEGGDALRTALDDILDRLGSSS